MELLANEMFRRINQTDCSLKVLNDGIQQLTVYCHYLLT